VFGGTGFVGRRVVQHLRESGTRVRIVSRHRGRAEDDGVEQIAADARDEHSVEAAVAGADGVVNAISLYVEQGSDTFHSVHVEAAAKIAKAASQAGIRPRLRPIFAAAVKVNQPCGPHFPAQSLSARR
jgi:uncharacterized protein YbjT (DUF2867 family)